MVRFRLLGFVEFKQLEWRWAYFVGVAYFVLFKITEIQDSDFG